MWDENLTMNVELERLRSYGNLKVESLATCCVREERAREREVQSRKLCAPAERSCMQSTCTGGTLQGHRRTV
jgi:hypothetical protein